MPTMGSYVAYAHINIEHSATQFYLFYLSVLSMLLLLPLLPSLATNKYVLLSLMYCMHTIRLFYQMIFVFISNTKIQ